MVMRMHACGFIFISLKTFEIILYICVLEAWVFQKRNFLHNGGSRKKPYIFHPPTPFPKKKVRIFEPPTPFPKKKVRIFELPYLFSTKKVVIFNHFLTTLP